MIIPDRKKPLETKISYIWYSPCVISLTGFKQVLLFICCLRMISNRPKWNSSYVVQYSN